MGPASRAGVMGPPARVCVVRSALARRPSLSGRPLRSSARISSGATTREWLRTPTYIFRRPGACRGRRSGDTCFGNPRSRRLALGRALNFGSQNSGLDRTLANGRALGRRRARGCTGQGWLYRVRGSLRGLHLHLGRRLLRCLVMKFWRWRLGRLHLPLRKLHLPLRHLYGDFRCLDFGQLHRWRRRLGSLDLHLRYLHLDLRHLDLHLRYLHLDLGRLDFRHLNLDPRRLSLGTCTLGTCAFGTSTLGACADARETPARLTAAGNTIREMQNFIVIPPLTQEPSIVMLAQSSGRYRRRTDGSFGGPTTMHTPRAIRSLPKEAGTGNGRSLIATAKASAKLSIWHHFLPFRSFPLFDRAAGFPSPRPQDADAGARRSCQGWPLFAATEGLAFT